MISCEGKPDDLREIEIVKSGVEVNLDHHAFKLTLPKNLNRVQGVEKPYSHKYQSIYKNEELIIEPFHEKNELAKLSELDKWNSHLSLASNVLRYRILRIVERTRMIRAVNRGEAMHPSDIEVRMAYSIHTEFGFPAERIVFYGAFEKGGKGYFIQYKGLARDQSNLQFKFESIVNSIQEDRQPA